MLLPRSAILWASFGIVLLSVWCGTNGTTLTSQLVTKFPELSLKNAQMIISCLVTACAGAAIAYDLVNCDDSGTYDSSDNSDGSEDQENSDGPEDPTGNDPMNISDTENEISNFEASTEPTEITTEDIPNFLKSRSYNEQMLREHFERDSRTY